MTWKFDEWLSTRPEAYVNKMLKNIGLKEPPFDAYAITDYLGIKVIEYDEACPEIKDFISETNKTKEWLASSGTLMRTIGKKRVIFTPKLRASERKRMNIYHECGHAILPWHSSECFLCSDKDTNPDTYKRIEREAFFCASSLLMPRSYFVADIHGLGSISFASLQLLKNKYHASLEATANWYAQNHPGICSVVMIEPINKEEPNYSEVEMYPEEQEYWKLGQSRVSFKLEEPIDHHIKVAYSVRSKRFPHRIKHNLGIEKTSVLYKAWANRQGGVGEIPGIQLGLFDTAPLRYECRPIGGYQQRMMVLLWEEDKQNLLIKPTSYMVA